MRHFWAWQRKEPNARDIQHQAQYISTLISESCAANPTAASPTGNVQRMPTSLSSRAATCKTAQQRRTNQQPLHTDQPWHCTRVNDGETPLTICTSVAPRRPLADCLIYFRDLQKQQITLVRVSFGIVSVGKPRMTLFRLIDGIAFEYFVSKPRVTQFRIIRGLLCCDKPWLNWGG